MVVKVTMLQLEDIHRYVHQESLINSGSLQSQENVQNEKKIDFTHCPSTRHLFYDESYNI